MNREIEVWEGEGGASLHPIRVRANSIAGTANQVAWAQLIKSQVNSEFDRVAAAFRSVAACQGGDKRADTEAIIVILEDKRSEVMSEEGAGYFIHDWQDIGDQVRQMIGHDPRHQAIKARRAARR